MKSVRDLLQSSALVAPAASRRAAHRVSRRAAFLLTMSVLVVLLSACGTPGEDLTGTWVRADDPGFVLTIDKAHAGYDMVFENTANGESQQVAGIYRGENEIQAAFELPQEDTGALDAGGTPDVVPITLRLEGDTLVVYSTAGGAEIELWRYGRQ